MKWKFEYHIKDHLGNNRVLFTDRNNDGTILNGSDGSGDNIQIYHYYPFGMTMDVLGNSYASNSTENPYQYNGKEIFKDFGFNSYNYGARWYDPAVGRFSGVDPLADAAPDWTPYRYGFNNPIVYIDPDGMFESRKEARQYAKDNNINTGLFGSGIFGGSRIGKQSDGSFAILSTSFSGNNIMETFIQDLGGELGVGKGVTVRANDKMSREKGWFSDDVTLRDGSVTNEAHKTVGLPVGASAQGVTMLGSRIVPKMKHLKNIYVDFTGKFHGVMPQVSELRRMRVSELKTFMNTLKKSVNKRIRLNARLGPKGNHGKRQGQEQDLIKSIEKILETRKGG